MIVRTAPDLGYSQVTPKREYLSRRRFAGAALALLVPAGQAAGRKLAAAVRSPYSTDEKLTPYQVVTTYNNFYEFGTEKHEPALRAAKFRVSPWTVRVEGLVAKPKVFDLDEVMKLAPLEERILRLRCVEGWSMVIPWIGFPLRALLNKVELLSKARYVAFQSYYDARQMISSDSAGISFPYIEGLRIDEAMHPLTTLAVGLYGEVLPNQCGAPLRLVVPWKYGFKSIKSVVRIRLVEKQPPTTWNRAIPQEYGFYANVNPAVAHPRWSQAQERRVGEKDERPTSVFNGYAEHVRTLYEGMDLTKNKN